MKRALFALLAVLALCGTARAQGYIYSAPVTNSRGLPVAGANVAVCTAWRYDRRERLQQPRDADDAPNPHTAGFASGSEIVVNNFTGADTYFNGTFQAILVSPTQISYVLTHANVSASTNGNVVQKGTASAPCAPLSPIYTDQTLSSSAPNPLTTDAFGNLAFWGVPQNYSVWIYGPTVTSTLYTVSAPCMPGSAGCAGSGAITGGVAGNLLQASGPTTGTDSGIVTANVAQKPPFTHPSGYVNGGYIAQYAAPFGNDANDGLSWGTAKLTWDAAAEALNGGSATGPVLGNSHVIGTGTIYIWNGTQACPASSSDGIYISRCGRSGIPVDIYLLGKYLRRPDTNNLRGGKWWDR